jgi:hypothetical protein
MSTNVTAVALDTSTMIATIPLSMRCWGTSLLKRDLGNQ